MSSITFHSFKITNFLSWYINYAAAHAITSHKILNFGIDIFTPFPSRVTNGILIAYYTPRLNIQNKCICNECSTSHSRHIMLYVFDELFIYHSTMSNSLPTTKA